MSNENGTSTVAAIGKFLHPYTFFTMVHVFLCNYAPGCRLLYQLSSRLTLRYSTMRAEDKSGNESDSSGQGGTYAAGSGRMTSKPPKKRFLQLYTSKAYGNQRSKLVQPHDNGEEEKDSKEPSSGSSSNGSPDRKPSASSSSTQLAIQRSSSAANLKLDEEHVLSPRIVEAVTHSTQVVWANCQKTEGLLGRSELKLQTAIGMPVGVDESGNVWVVVMFSPKNVESTTDAIDYLQYISRSAASTSIPCLLPVVGEPNEDSSTVGVGGTKMICNGDAIDDEEGKGDNDNNQQQPQHHALVSIKPKKKQPDHTQELGEGVTAKFVSFKISDEDENNGKPKNSLERSGSLSTQYNDDAARRLSENDLRDAPKDDWGIPMLPETSELGNSGNSRRPPNNLPFDIIDNAITDAFDEASYGVWSTIMNSAGGDTIRTSKSIATKMHLIQERLEEFATAFLGMSVFDVADAWTVSSNSPTGEDPILKCLFTVAATNTNPGINALMNISGNASITIADGAVGKAYSSGYPVWSSVKELIYDSGRKQALEDCKIETAFAVPIFASGDVSPSCVLSCYSLLPAESVPFVLNFVQKAVRLLWSGLDRVVNPHESVGKELWKDVGPADLGEMAADVEMQKAFIGKKRPRGQSFQDAESGRDRTSPSVVLTETNTLPSLAQLKAPSPTLKIDQPMDLPTFAPPAKGLAPAPGFPSTIQERSPNAQQFLYLDSGNNGHWAVQQAVQSVGQLWDIGTGNNNFVATQQQEQEIKPAIKQQPVESGGTLYSEVHPLPMLQQPNPLQYQQPQQQQQYQPLPKQQPQHEQFHLSHVNYQPTNTAAAAMQPQQPPQQQQSTPLIQQPHQQQHQHKSHPPIQKPQQQQPMAAYPPQGGVHMDDPAVIHANLMEFNIMAQMNNSVNAQLRASSGVPLASPGMVAPLTNGLQNNASYINQPLPLTVGGTNHNLDQMAAIPVSQANESVVLPSQQQALPQQSLYCTATARPATTQSFDPVLFSDKTPCRIEGCNDLSVARRPYCAKHCGSRTCEKEGCNKCAQGTTRFCIAHGGGRRCTFPGCDKGARDRYFCAAHGGGKRCKREGCNKSAVGGSNFCTGHGGGRRCHVPGCDKSAQSSTKFCVKHGGGKKCQHPECEKVSRGKTLYCAAHGGGVRCKLDGCNRVAIGKAQLCRAHGGGSQKFYSEAL